MYPDDTLTIKITFQDGGNQRQFLTTRERLAHAYSNRLGIRVDSLDREDAYFIPFTAIETISYRNEDNHE